jgi:chromosome segregation ATPase
MLNSRFVSENERLFFTFRELLSRVEEIIVRYDNLKSTNQFLTSSIEKMNKTLAEFKENNEKLEIEKSITSDDMMKLQKSVLEKDEMVVNFSDEIKKFEELNKSLQVKLASKEDDVNKIKNFYDVELNNLKESFKEKERQLEDLTIKYESKVDILIAENQNLEEKLKKSGSATPENKMSFKSDEHRGHLILDASETGLTGANRKEIKEKINKIIEKIDEMIS